LSGQAAKSGQNFFSGVQRHEIVSSSFKALAWLATALAYCACNKNLDKRRELCCTRFGWYFADNWAKFADKTKNLRTILRKADNWPQILGAIVGK
jgi:hypothetical protein